MIGQCRNVPATRIHCVATATAAVALIWAAILHPALSAPATPGSDSPPVCDVPARSPDEVVALLRAGGIATPAATTGGQTLPEGIPADAETATVMERVVRLWLACQNEGEALRAWSLFSDGYLYRLLSRQGAPLTDAYRVLATPAPTSIEASTLLEIKGQRILPDGRLGTTVVIAYPSVPMPKRFFFYFTRVDSRLLIDGILGEISFSVP
jgi:hypothetical protein